MIGLINPEQLPAGTQIELEGLVKRLNALLAVEHNDNGTHRLGLFTDVAYGPGIYQAVTAGQTWTVTRPSQVTYQYSQIGKLVVINLMVELSSTSGSSSLLSIQLPNNFQAATKQAWVITYNDGSVITQGKAFANALGRQIFFIRNDMSNWPAASGTLTIEGTFLLRVV